MLGARGSGEPRKKLGYKFRGVVGREEVVAAGGSDREFQVTAKDRLRVEARRFSTKARHKKLLE